MFAALPTPTKIYYSLGNNFGNCPITIRDGRKWLEKQQIDEHFEFKSKKNRINTEPILELKDVWFRYEKNSDDILKGLSFKVRKNEFYAIVGGNGVGKSTALSVISKINRPYRGKVFINDNTKVAVMPQNPQSLFLKKSVLEELYDAVFDVEKEKRENEIEYVIKLCELDNLLENHPYDLSGGEQQRAALAKMLLRKPDLLVLDEPTKGLDACFKRKLATILKSLQKNGMTVLMVTHDIEFCAEYADICAMFFDGKIVSEAPPRKFFAENNFYTTSAKRMADGIIENAVLDKDIIRALGGEAEDLTETNVELNYILQKKTVIKQSKKEYKKLKQFVNIAVAGTEKHIGVTTQAILITMFLKSLNMNACYICATDKDEIKNIETLEGVAKKDGFYTYKGIDLYSNDNKIDAMQYGYDFYIYDYGILNENTLDNFLSKEIKIIVGGTKAWETDETFRVLSLLEKIPDVNYIFNFSSNEEKAKFKRILKQYIKHIYFSEYTTDTFNSNINTDMYHEIFKEYITEKSNKLEVVEKKGLFSFLKRGR